MKRVNYIIHSLIIRLLIFWKLLGKRCLKKLTCVLYSIGTTVDLFLVRKKIWISSNVNSKENFWWIFLIAENILIAVCSTVCFINVCGSSSCFMKLPKQNRVPFIYLFLSRINCFWAICIWNNGLNSFQSNKFHFDTPKKCKAFSFQLFFCASAHIIWKWKHRS